MSPFLVSFLDRTIGKCLVSCQTRHEAFFSCNRIAYIAVCTMLTAQDRGSFSNIDRQPATARENLEAETTAQRHRQEYLTLIAEMQATPVVCVFGQSGSGKSTSVKTLESDLGIKPSIRYTTRPTRPNGHDGFERNWQVGHALGQPVEEESDNQIKKISGANTAMLHPSDTLFAIYNYGNYYGTSAGEVAESVLSSSEGTGGVSVLLGKMLDLPNFHEALSNMLPIWPCIDLRLMVEPFQLKDRLERRAAAGQEGRSGEVQERLAVLMRKYEEDQAQIPAYCELYQLNLISVPVPSELNKFHLKNVMPLSGHALQTWLPTAIMDVRKQAAARAKDMLRERRIPEVASTSRQINPEVLKYTVLLSERFGIPHLYLSGLTGVAAYLLDTDGVFPQSTLGEGTKIEVALPSGPERGTKYADFLRAIEEGQQHDPESRGVQAGQGVLIRLANAGFSYELPCDHTAQILARSLRLSDTSKIFLLPPENLLVETLLKYRTSPDHINLLNGAFALLATQDLDWNVIHKLIFSQSFSAVLDTEAVRRLSEKVHTYFSVKDILRHIMDDPGDLCAAFPTALSNRLVDPSKTFDLPTDNTPTSVLSLTALKQLVMIGELCLAVDDLIRHLNEGRLHIKQQNFLRLWDGKASTQLLRFRTAIGVFRDYQVGRGDIYVRRDKSPKIPTFFSAF